MHLITLITTSLPLLLCNAAPSFDLVERQVAGPECRRPSNFQAFNVGNCESQLTFSRGFDTGVQWAFDAFYADGSSATFEPHRNFDNYAVSDTIGSRDRGLNYITTRTQDTIYTSIHEFTNVCRNGVAPSAWVFRTTSRYNACENAGRGNGLINSGRIATRSGTRPAKTTVSARQINSAGDLEISWTAVSGASTYNPLVKVPTSSYTGGGGFFYSNCGTRFSASTTRVIFPGVLRLCLNGAPRFVNFNVQNAQGIWSHTPSTVPITVNVR